MFKLVSLIIDSQSVSGLPIASVFPPQWWLVFQLVKTFLGEEKDMANSPRCQFMTLLHW